MIGKAAAQGEDISARTDIPEGACHVPNSQKPLSGDNSWASDNGAALQATVSAELKRAMKYMLNDIVSPAPRDDARKIVVSGYYPFIKGKFEIVGYQLGDDDDSVMFSPRIADTTQ